MRSYGLVRAIDGKFVEVVVPKGGECKRCGACLISASDHTSIVRAVNRVGAKIGDRVEIEISPKDAVLGAFFVFILPLIVATFSGVAGLLIGSRVRHGYLFASILGGIGLVFSFIIVRLIYRRKGTGAYAAVVEVIEQ